MVAIESPRMTAVVALKVAVVAVACTVTDAGTVNVESSLDRVTLAPPVGAGWVRVTVQMLEELGPTLVGVQANEETCTEAGLSATICIVQPLVAEPVAA